MNLNIFVPLDLNKISQLTFIEKTVPFMFLEAKDSPVVSGAVHQVSFETYEKLEKTFLGKDDVVIKPGDKVYVFPGCKIPQFKIKASLKEIGAKFTSNYEEATVYLGSANSVKECQNHDFSVNLLAGRYFNCIYRCWDIKEERNEDRYAEQLHHANSFYVRSSWGTIGSAIGLFQCADSAAISSYTMLTILGAEILYRKLSLKIPIMSEDAFMKQTSPTCIIDKEMYQTLNDMLNSKDDNDNQLALQTIANCDIENSKLYIYLLVQYHYEKFNGSRFKNIKLFNDMIDLKETYDQSIKDFIIKLMADGTDNISKDVAKQLFDIESDKFINENTCHGGSSGIQLESDLFDIILVPKEKFKAIVPELTYTYELDDE